MNYSIVIPTIGRETLPKLLNSIDRQEHQPRSVHVIHDVDRRGPAWARNQGWRQSASEWVVFLDDDVLLPDDWSQWLVKDLAVPAVIAGVQGLIYVPHATGDLTDDERMTVGLQQATWASADMAYRRAVLEVVDGFDEQFPRAYREDSDLAIRVQDAGFLLSHGTRVTVHPLRQDPFWASVKRQKGNADDIYMLRKHGVDWRERALAPRGRIATHWLTTAALLRAPRSLFAFGLWLGLTAAFIRHRYSKREPLKMFVTSALIPPAAVFFQVKELMFDRTKTG